MLKTRVKTAAVLSAITVVFFCFSYIRLVTAALTAFLACAAVWELFRPVRTEKYALALSIPCYIFAAGIMFVRKIPCYEPILAGVFVLSVLLFALRMAFPDRFAPYTPLRLVPVSVMASLFFRTAGELRAADFGLLNLLLCAAVFLATDTAAYFVGRRWGRTKIAPRISPNKSVQGCVGGLIACVTLVAALCCITYAVEGVCVNTPLLLVYLPIASVVDQFGDFSMSSIKRSFGIKDFSNLMPGHGGILDRFDSILFIMPFTWLMIWLCGPFFF